MQATTTIGLDIAKSVRMAIAVSKAAAGRNPEGHIVMASYVFMRMCVAADTLLYVLRRDIGSSKELTLDHYSTGVLARNIIESALMFYYLSEEGVSKEEWELRIAIFNLHDSTLKVRLWKGLESDEQYKNWKATMEEIRQSLREHPTFKTIDADRQQRLLSGQELYLKGFRSNLKLVGLDEGYFDGLYTYLSSQVHITPSSFYWTPAYARMLLLRAAIRLAESDEAVRQKIDAAIHKEMNELAEIPFGE